MGCKILCADLYSVHSLFMTLYLVPLAETRPNGYKKNSCTTQLSKKFILLINVKMPTIVSIFTFISMINLTSERLKERNVFICRYCSFYELLLKFGAQLS